jgi:hypothetical protein
MERFSDLLGQAIHRIRWCENNKPISVIQDELGYALERSGGTAIAYWRKGHVPNVADLEKLARELIRRSDLDRAWLLRFLESAGYPFAHHLADELFPTQSSSSDRAPSTLLTTPTLPANTYHHLIGRDAQRRELLALLGDPHAHPLLAVDGAGGIGKTALIYDVALECRKRKLFDHIIWADASAGHPDEVDALSLERILRLVGSQLGLSGFAQLPENLLAAQLGRLLRTQRVLLVLDSLEAAGHAQEEIVQGLRPLLGVSRALFASRRRFVGDLYALHLAGLDAVHFRPFLQQEARVRGLLSLETAPAAELQQIFTATGGHPLAIKFVVGQLGFLPLAFVLERLHDVTLLANPDDHDEYVRMYTDLFLPTWSRLSEGGKQLLTTMSLFVPGVGGSIDAIRTISELAPDTLVRALNELWRLSLLEVCESQGGSLHDKRYCLHTLTRNFVHLAIDAAHDLTLSAERTRATLEFINYYLTLAGTQAGAAHTRELDNLTTTLQLIHDQRQPDLLLLGVEAICPHLIDQGRYAEAILHLERAEQAARYENALRPLALVLLRLGIALQKIGHTDEAVVRLQEALALAQTLADDPLHQAVVEALS